MSVFDPFEMLATGRFPAEGSVARSARFNRAADATHVA